ncbi:hypothetical protein NKL07_18000 [Mesorhizobium sp. C280B]|nr:hypothetical protein [Mesorhizobium sp. LSJC280B00]ESW80727.1 hypothetical protein X772_24295 [Mesorhizobium sp. LSJC280B00]
MRAGYAADQARTTQPKKQVAQKVRTQRPVAQKPAKQQQVVQKRRFRKTVVRRDDPPPPQDNDFLTKALLFGSGVVAGGVLKN